MMTQKVSDYYRYCPDQPKIKISDAVCLSRRRVHFPHCPGCPFNDERDTPEPAAGEVQDDDADHTPQAE